jgi:polyhydroxybutyrate depolymerase
LTINEVCMSIRARQVTAIAAMFGMALASACGSSDGANPSANPVESEGCDASKPARSSGTGLPFDIAGEDRTYNLSVPANASDDALPVVVNLHGALGTSDAQDASSGWPALGDREGFVVITPQAVGPDRFWRLADDSPDFAFVTELVDDVANDVCIDENRIYLAGFSSGGMLSMALACREPDRYAGIAVVAGLIDLESCHRTTAVPMIAFHGTADDTIHFDGTYPEGIRQVLQSPETPRSEIAEKWALDNGCDGAPPAEAIDGVVTVETFSCPPGSDVQFYRIDGGTHRWPGGTLSPLATGTTSAADRAVNATETIWEFFEGLG